MATDQTTTASTSLAVLLVLLQGLLGCRAAETADLGAPPDLARFDLSAL